MTTTDTVYAISTVAFIMLTAMTGNPMGILMTSFQLQEINYLTYVNTKSPLLDSTVKDL
jgi:hypothetical protein